ncbi:MAG: hypothetical protein ABID35_07585, partial [Candidatus Margulisiibacteriota bacterium]
YPTISRAVYSSDSGQTSIRGTCEASVGTVEVYKVESTPDPSGYGEGKYYLGTATASGGTWNILLTGLTTADSVTALNTDSSGNSSEFGYNIAVTAFSGKHWIIEDSIKQLIFIGGDKRKIYER